MYLRQARQHRVSFVMLILLLIFKNSQSRLGRLENQVALILDFLTDPNSQASASLPPCPPESTHSNVHPSAPLQPPPTHSRLPFTSETYLLPSVPGNYLGGQDLSSVYNPEPIRLDEGGSSCQIQPLVCILITDPL